MSTTTTTTKPVSNLGTLSTLKSLAGVLLATVGATNTIPSHPMDYAAMGAGALVVAAYIIGDALSGKSLKTIKTSGLQTTFKNVVAAIEGNPTPVTTTTTERTVA